jgi:hypothetical protein
VTDYVECPFCERVFPAEVYHSMMHTHPLEDHIRDDHHKVKLRKGSNYRWVDKKEIEARLVAPEPSPASPASSRRSRTV